MSTSKEPIHLPTALIGEAPSVKLLYLWLLGNGEVTMSQRHISVALGITQANVSLATQRLVELGLVQRVPEENSRARKTLRVI